MRELEGIAFCQKIITIIMTAHQALSLWRHQINTHQLRLLPGKRKRIAVTVTAIRLRQQAIRADKINPVAIIIEDSG